MLITNRHYTARRKATPLTDTLQYPLSTVIYQSDHLRFNDALLFAYEGTLNHSELTWKKTE
jgi:hypothetical protein